MIDNYTKYPFYTESDGSVYGYLYIYIILYYIYIYCLCVIMRHNIFAVACWPENVSGAAKYPAHRSAPFTGVPLTAPFQLRRPPAPLRTPQYRSDLKGRRSAPRISQPSEGLPLYTRFFHFSQVGTY